MTVNLKCSVEGCLESVHSNACGVCKTHCIMEDLRN